MLDAICGALPRIRSTTADSPTVLVQQDLWLYLEDIRANSSTESVQFFNLIICESGVHVFRSRDS